PIAVRFKDLHTRRYDETGPAYIAAYWPAIHTVIHLAGPMSEEAAAEAASFDLNMKRAVGDRPPGDTLMILTADHGHAFTDPDKIVDLLGDDELRSLLRNPIAGEPRLAFLHTDHAGPVRDHIEARWPDTFILLSPDELHGAGLFRGRGATSLAKRRVGEVCAMLATDRAARIMRVDGQAFRHRGSHGGLSS